ncbi:hypothetical protein JW960_22065 [candidate division KSB1 bacterium]|nr:hypothetical protein [candidate division KSB1 bacterium]
MPRSQLQTPVVSYILTITHVRLLPSARLKDVGFLPDVSGIIRMIPTIQTSELNTDPAFVAPPIEQSAPTHIASKNKGELFLSFQLTYFSQR